MTAEKTCLAWETTLLIAFSAAAVHATDAVDRWRTSTGMPCTCVHTLDHRQGRESHAVGALPYFYFFLTVSHWCSWSPRCVSSRSAYTSSLRKAREQVYPRCSITFIFLLFPFANQYLCSQVWSTSYLFGNGYRRIATVVIMIADNATGVTRSGERRIIIVKRVQCHNMFIRKIILMTLPFHLVEIET